MRESSGDFCRAAFTSSTQACPASAVKRNRSRSASLAAAEDTVAAGFSAEAAAGVPVEPSPAVPGATPSRPSIRIGSVMRSACAGVSLGSVSLMERTV